jgi:hypothetical protein
LLDFDVGTRPTHQARVAMPKRVPANLVDRHARLQVDVPSQNALLPAWLPLKVTDEFLPTTTGSLAKIPLQSSLALLSLLAWRRLRSGDWTKTRRPDSGFAQPTTDVPWRKRRVRSYAPP